MSGETEGQHNDDEEDGEAKHVHNNDVGDHYWEGMRGAKTLGEGNCIEPAKHQSHGQIERMIATVGPVGGKP